MTEESDENILWLQTVHDADDVGSGSWPRLLNGHRTIDDEPPVHVSGYLVRSFDRGHNFDDAERYSEILVEDYRTDSSRGLWCFMFYPDANVVRIEHSHITRYGPGGTWKEAGRDEDFEVSADLWRYNAVGVMATFVDLEIATGAAPMLQIPPKDEVDAELAAERHDMRAELARQDVGLATRSETFLLDCWFRGAISHADLERFELRWDIEG